MTGMISSFCRITDLFRQQQTTIQIRREQAMKQRIRTLNQSILIITKMRQTVINKMLQRAQRITARGGPAEIGKVSGMQGKFTFNQLQYIQINLIALKAEGFTQCWTT